MARAFVELGALVVDADRLAREALAPGTPGFGRVTARFPSVVAARGEIDRAALAAIVFRDRDARDDLGAIVHPEVRRLGAQWEATAAPDQIVVHDVPLLFEAGFYRFCDANVVVIADRQARIGRVLARGLDATDIEARMAAQIDPERARELADYTIDNDGTVEALRAAVGAVYEDLLERIPAVSRARTER